MTATIEVRAGTPADWPGIWRALEPVFRAGETYTYPRDITEADARAAWLDAPGEMCIRDRSQQERQIVALIGEGLTNREIGKRLYLAEKTVKNYVSHVLATLGLQRRTQVAVLATEMRQEEASRQGAPGAGGPTGDRQHGGPAPVSYTHLPAISPSSSTLG